MEATFLDQNVPPENEPFDFLRLFRTFDRSARVSLNPNQIIILRTINLARKSSKNDSDGESARSQNSTTMIRTLVSQNTKFLIPIGQNLSFFDTLTFFLQVSHLQVSDVEKIEN